jgi:hypothetical protein
VSCAESPLAFATDTADTSHEKKSHWLQSPGDRTSGRTSVERCEERVAEVADASGSVGHRGELVGLEEERREGAVAVAVDDAAWDEHCGS